MMNSFLSKIINNLLSILILAAVLYLAYNYFDWKSGNEERLRQLEAQRERNELIIKKIDSLSVLRRDTLQIVTNNYKTILSKQEEVINEIDTTSYNDSLIALYYKFRPDSLLFE